MTADDDSFLDGRVEVAFARSRPDFDRQVAEWRSGAPQSDLHVRWRQHRDGGEYWQAATPTRPWPAHLPDHLRRSTTFVEVEHDGWIWHDSTPLGGTEGDAWIEAPDGSRVGVVWEASAATTSFEQIGWDDDASERWGVYGIETPLAMQNVDDARACVKQVLPELLPRWHARRSERS